MDQYLNNITYLRKQATYESNIHSSVGEYDIVKIRC
jgi:hypothetical protein